MDYDELVHSKDIQILKSMLPFIDRQQQMPLAIMIQFIEFQKIIQIFRNKENFLAANVIHNENERKTEMIQALMKHFSPEEQESMNNMMNIMTMMSMMSTESMMENFESFTL